MRFWLRREDGQTMAEYSVVLTVLALTAFVFTPFASAVFDSIERVTALIPG